MAKNTYKGARAAALQDRLAEEAEYRELQEELDQQLGKESSFKEGTLAYNAVAGDGNVELDGLQGMASWDDEGEEKPPAQKDPLAWVSFHSLRGQMRSCCWADRAFIRSWGCIVTQGLLMKASGSKPCALALCVFLAGC